MGVCSCQPLAKSKGVHREVESEGSWRQSSDPRNTNIIRHIRSDKFAKQSEVLKLHGDRGVNDAGTRDEGYSSYHGRSRRRDETKYESRLKKICCEKSAEIIVPDATTTSGKDRTLRSESK